MEKEFTNSKRNILTRNLSTLISFTMAIILSFALIFTPIDTTNAEAKIAKPSISSVSAKSNKVTIKLKSKVDGAKTLSVQVKYSLDGKTKTKTYKGYKNKTTVTVTAPKNSTVKSVRVKGVNGKSSGKYSSWQKTKTTSSSGNKTDKVTYDSNGDVWIPRTGKKYHSSSTCSNMKSPTKVTKEKAIELGFTACSKCH